DSWKTGGGSQWTGISYDPDLGSIFVPIGNPGPDFDGASRPGDNLFSNTTMVLNPDNGLLRYWFQYTPHDPWDYDGVNEVILADIDGRKVWLHADRNGHLYSIDRTNGRCLWVVEITEINWVTGFGDNCRPIVNPDYDPEVQGYGVVTMGIHPTLDGGKEWHPMAYSPKTGMVYVPVINNGGVFTSGEVMYIKGQMFMGSAMTAVENEASGHIKAIDVKTGEIRWEMPTRSPMLAGLLTTASPVLAVAGEGSLFADRNLGGASEHHHRIERPPRS
ncbi:MAG: PQQ-binding-like beta-propeller repeat protein, partial [Acidobacteria bacterium]|nr:PQQ-binding-like beta-propeller repeat protein [Acidobacteriota bacterium]